MLYASRLGAPLPLEQPHLHTMVELPLNETLRKFVGDGMDTMTGVWMSAQVNPANNTNHRLFINEFGRPRAVVSGRNCCHFCHARPVWT